MTGELPSAVVKFLARQAQPMREWLSLVLNKLRQAAAQGNAALPEYLAALKPPKPQDWALLIEAAARLAEPQILRALAVHFNPPEDKTVYKAWKRVRHYLETRGLPIPELPAGPAPARSLESQPQLEAYLSPYDRRATRLIIIEKLSGHFRDNTLLLVIQEDQGIIDGYSLWLSKKKQRQHREELAEMTPGQLITVPLAYAVGLLEEAYQLNPQAGNEGVRAYRIWQDWLLSLVNQQSVSVSDLLGPPAPEELLGDLQAETGLLAQPELVPFLPQPEQLTPWLKQIQAVDKSPLVLPGHLQKQRYEDLVDQICQAIYPHEKRPKLSHRLQELAYYFFQTGRPLAARQAQIVAQELAVIPSALQTEPKFLRLLVVGALTESAELGKEVRAQAEEQGLIITKW